MTDKNEDESMIARALDNETQKDEWISTKEAAKLLKVKTTVAVRYLMIQHPNELHGINFGSEEQPRWVLRRAEVIAFQEKRERGGIRK